MKSSSVHNSTSRKQKLREQLQDQLLSNYYLSKYQNYMAKWDTCGTSQSKRKEQAKANQSRSLSVGSTESKKAQNFKHLILQKKKAKKNFKSEVKERSIMQRDKKVAYEMFDKVKDSINEELQSKTPSKLETGGYKSIQVMSKTITVSPNSLSMNRQSYYAGNPYASQNASRMESFIVPLTEENIEVKETVEDQFQEDSFEQYEDQKRDQIEIKMIESAIRGNFQRHWERASHTSSLSKYKPISSRASSPDRNKRPNTEDRYSRNGSTNPKKESFNSRSSQLRHHSLNKQINMPDSSLRKSNLASHSNYARSQKNSTSLLGTRRAQQKGTDRNSMHNYSGFAKVGFNDQSQFPIFPDAEGLFKDQEIYMNLSNSSKFRDSSSFAGQIKVAGQDSGRTPFNSHFINNLEQISALQTPAEGRSVRSYNGQDLNTKVNPFSIDAQEDQPPLQLRQSTHDLSNISRFSMTSVEGTQIRKHLCKQIDQNQFGPYQNALGDLRDLIEEYPTAWPIFVVGQRILQDRQEYELKKQNQNDQIESLKDKIFCLNRKIRSNQVRTFSGAANQSIGGNQVRILQLLRKLSDKL